MKVGALILNRYYMAVLHFMVWSLLFILPFFYNIGDFTKFEVVLIINWIPLLYFALIYFLNYFILIKKLLFQNNITLFVVTNIALIFLFLYFIELTKSFYRPEDWPERTSEFKKWVNFRLTFSLIISVVVSIAVKLAQRWLEYDKVKTERENQFLKTELEMLKYQVHPHFFFNALNNIYSLIDISPEKAKATVHGLGKLMRYLLYETSTETVSLAKEIEFTKNFVALMKLRVSDRVKVTEIYPSESELFGIQIPPLLFISFIENAFKHGVSAENQNEILITLTIENGELFFIVQNNNFPKSKEDKGGSGVGMENLRVRLQKLYPGKHDYFQQRKDNYFTTSLKITL
jgi:sensor histidine kinase YesM